MATGKRFRVLVEIEVVAKDEDGAMGVVNDVLDIAQGPDVLRWVVGDAEVVESQR